MNGWRGHEEEKSSGRKITRNSINHGAKIAAADGVADKHDDFLPATGKTI